MSDIFVYYNDTKKTSIKFSYILKSNRCNITCYNSRCKNHTYAGIQTCNTHLRLLYNVNIKESRILKQLGCNELGVFAFKSKNISDYTTREPVFKQGTLICENYGEILTKEEIDTRYGVGNNFLAPYAWELSDGTFIDTACVRSIVTYVNSNFGTGIPTNVSVVEGPGPCLHLIALKDIFNNEELLVSYGTCYFTGHYKNHETKKVMTHI